MNKFGIKLYSSGVTYIDGISYLLNSINHQDVLYNRYRYRMIDNKIFGIWIRIEKK